MVLAEKKYVPVAYQPQAKARVRKKQKLRKNIRVVSLILAIFGLGLFYTYKHYQVIHAGYQIAAVKQNIATLQRDNKTLEFKIAGLQAPQRVENIARTKLGMKEPDDLLLAAVSSVPAPVKEELQPEHQANGSKERNVLFVAARHLIGRAEAAPR